MPKVTRKPFIAIVSLMVVISLSLAPVAHASLLVFHAALDEGVEMGQPCDQAAAGIAGGSSHQHQEQANSPLTTDCDHGSTCELLCSVSVSTNPHMNPYTLQIEGPIQWISHDMLALKSSFLSRLDRPPRP